MLGKTEAAGSAAGASHLPGAAPRRRRRHPLIEYTLRRLGLMALLALGITIITFVLANIIPIDPVVANLGERAAANPEVVAAYRARYGLDQPLIVQYVIYLGNLLRGDFGMSQQTGRPVLADLLAFAPATLELVIGAIVFSLLVGVTLGTAAALRRGGAPDHAARFVSLIGVSTPIFWLGIVASYVFFAQLHLLPSGGRVSPTMPRISGGTGFLVLDSILAGNPAILGDVLQHLVLPATVLGASTLGLIVRFTRTSVLEVSGNDYVRSAKAKGLAPRSVVGRYILRGAAGPILTVTGVAFGGLLAGTVLVETVFNWPGLGQYAFRAASTADLSAIMGVTLFVSLSYIIINFIVDLLYMVIDPRVRLT
ncbi:MAG TPA: ABC transporter permease [Pseudolysinimonas sp.]|nr:ABC transporter permease [Pseudolysinimonas sp.]